MGTNTCMQMLYVGAKMPYILTYMLVLKLINLVVFVEFN
jgi:hypothetical protein